MARYRSTLKSLASLALAGLLLAIHSAIGGAPPTRAIEGRALDAAPESRVEAAQVIDAAVAAALIGAISTQFGERKVEVKLDRMQVDPANLIDSTLSGEGRLRIGDDDDWLPMRFKALYDSRTASVPRQELVLGSDGVGEEIQVGSVLGRALQDRATDQLQAEFVQQPLRLRLDQVTRSEVGRRYTRLEGVGAVNFEEGSAPFSVDALYDEQAEAWLRMAYELSTGAERADAAPPIP